MAEDARTEQEPIRLPGPYCAPDAPLAPVIERNIRKLIEMRRSEQRRQSWQDHMAATLVRVCGSTPFALAHILAFAAWAVINQGWTPLRPFDPYPFGLLTLIVSLEGVLLATFVLISQNREAALADKRADLDLQISLLSEHEVTRILVMVDGLCRHFNIPVVADPEMEELQKDVSPEALLEKIEAEEEASERSEPSAPLERPRAA
jgi:uncharacterized membrane protein